jgi:hypothetical protein
VPPARHRQTLPRGARQVPQEEKEGEERRHRREPAKLRRRPGGANFCSFKLLGSRKREERGERGRREDSLDFTRFSCRPRGIVRHRRAERGKFHRKKKREKRGGTAESPPNCGGDRVGRFNLIITINQVQSGPIKEQHISFTRTTHTPSPIPTVRQTDTPCRHARAPKRSWSPDSPRGSGRP